MYKEIGILILSVLFLLCFMTFGVGAMSYSIHRGMFEETKIVRGQPYSYEEFELCTGGIYKNLEEYKEFYKYNTLGGSEILNKEKYEIISKKIPNFPFGTPSWEKESYYYCLKNKEVNI